MGDVLVAGTTPLIFVGLSGIGMGAAHLLYLIFAEIREFRGKCADVRGSRDITPFGFFCQQAYKIGFCCGFGPNLARHLQIALRACH